MKKKGVVLLITLFFITTISILVLKNLDDTDKFLVNQNYILNNTQILISIKNVKYEVSKLLKKYKHEIDKTLEEDELVISFKIDDLNISFRIKGYEKININEIKNQESRTIEDFFIRYNIPDYYDFSQTYKEKLKNNNDKIVTSKQLDDIINTFIIKNDNKEIIKHRDKLGFIKPSNSYELFIDINYNNIITSAYYLLSSINEKVEVQYFDISFK